jgi:hypothetical protein
MFGRRNFLHAALIGAAPGIAEAREGPTSGLGHRRYSGTVRYVHDAKGEVGREDFTVTVQPNGLRTLRAVCELYPERILRDVLITVDATWTPQVAHVQLTVAGEFQGSSWYRFADGIAACEGVNVQQGRFSEAFDATPDFFGAHPVHCDSWRLALLRRRGVELRGAALFTTSTAPMGGSGPALVRIDPAAFRYEIIGREKVKTAAGTFEAEHFQFAAARSGAQIDAWATVEDCAPLRLRVANAPQHYELIALAGEAR